MPSGIGQVFSSAAQKNSNSHEKPCALGVTAWLDFAELMSPKFFFRRIFLSLHSVNLSADSGSMCWTPILRLTSLGACCSSSLRALPGPCPASSLHRPCCPTARTSASLPPRQSRTPPRGIFCSASRCDKLLTSVNMHVPHPDLRCAHRVRAQSICPHLVCASTTTTENERSLGVNKLIFLAAASIRHPPAANLLGAS